MKSSLYFGIKLEKRAHLHKLKSYLHPSKSHPKIKITQNNNNNNNKKQIKQNSKNKEKNKTKENA